jgi:hypothetical protein
MTDLSPRQQRAAAKEAERAAQQAAWQAQRQAEKQAEAQAAFAASPVGQAIAARDRGDRFYQVELTVSELSGGWSQFGSSENASRQVSGATDLLGQIEDVGWRLEHTGFVFVETGATSTDRMFSTGQGTVTRGDVRGIYLFRRVHQS